jgi:hypothetical protein
VKRSKTTEHRTQGESCRPASIQFRTQSALKIAAISQAANTNFIRQFMFRSALGIARIFKPEHALKPVFSLLYFQFGFRHKAFFFVQGHSRGIVLNAGFARYDSRLMFRRGHITYGAFMHDMAVREKLKGRSFDGGGRLLLDFPSDESLPLWIDRGLILRAPGEKQA